MKINTIKIQNEGYITCKSGFYSSVDMLSNNSVYTFSRGINKLIGDIDSGNWAVSYLLSMYEFRPKDFILFGQPKAVVDKKVISLHELSEYSCYMDKLHPLFTSKKSVKKLVMQGLKYNKSSYSLDYIKDLFKIDNERFERPLTEAGNEIFKAMSAIGYCHNKEIFCFPWLSEKRFKGYHNHLTELLDVLVALDKIVVLPIGLMQRGL